MTFCKQHFLGLLLWSIIVLTFGACTNSDQYLFNSSTPNESISVKALLTTSFDSSVAKVKSDTIRPGDSLIFLTEVYPSKSIGHKRYFWLLVCRFLWRHLKRHGLRYRRDSPRARRQFIHSCLRHPEHRT